MSTPHYGVSYQVYDGNKALTTQPFSELNSKNGTQWQFAFYDSAVVGLGNVDLILITGDEHVIIKGVISYFKGDGIQSTLYKSPGYTGGSSLPYYNMRDDFNGTGLMQIIGGATVSAAGTKVSPSITALGQGTGNPTPGINISAIGAIERILLPNSVYLYRVNNLDAAAQPVTGITSWYEGPLSTDIKVEA